MDGADGRREAIKGVESVTAWLACLVLIKMTFDILLTKSFGEAIDAMVPTYANVVVTCDYI